MKLLSVLALLVASSTNAIATSVDEFYGTWTGVKVFRGSDSTYSACPIIELGSSDIKCTCDGVELASYNEKIAWGNRPSHAFIADTQEAAFDFARRPCRDACDDFNVLRKIDNNYIIMYYSARPGEAPDAVLLAKSVPSLTELDSVVNNLNGFENKFKITPCDLK